jgi:hypothetical protein
MMEYFSSGAELGRIRSWSALSSRSIVNISMNFRYLRFVCCISPPKSRLLGDVLRNKMQDASQFYACERHINTVDSVAKSDSYSALRCTKFCSIRMQHKPNMISLSQSLCPILFAFLFSSMKIFSPPILVLQVTLK